MKFVTRTRISRALETTGLSIASGGLRGFPLAAAPVLSTAHYTENHAVKLCVNTTVKCEPSKRACLCVGFDVAQAVLCVNS